MPNERFWNITAGVIQRIPPVYLTLLKLNEFGLHDLRTNIILSVLTGEALLQSLAWIFFTLKNEENIYFPINSVKLTRNEKNRLTLTFVDRDSEIDL